MGSSVGGRDLDFGVVTWKSHCGQKRCRDIGDSVGGRDMDLVLRHRLSLQEVAT